MLPASAAVVRATTRVNPRAHKFVGFRQILFAHKHLIIFDRTQPKPLSENPHLTEGVK
jgi:hypothetical protein